MSAQRYDLTETSRNPYESYRDMKADADGDWVRYDDHVAEAASERSKLALDLNSSRARYDLYRAHAETMVQSLRADLATEQTEHIETREHYRAAKASLATVTAERDDALKAERVERADCTKAQRELAETRKALEFQRDARAALVDEYLSTRAALARSEARVKTLGHRSTLDHEVLAALSRVPDITLSEGACTPGLHWEPVRKAERARRG